MKTADEQRVLDALTPAERKQLAAGRAQAKREKWADRIVGPQDLYALAEGCRLDARFADHAQAFFEQGLVHATGRWAGDPFILQDWQRDQLIRPLFGWRRPDGTRRFRSAFVFVAKKNGKSTLCGGLILYQLAGEPDPDHLERTEQAAEIYAASTSREIASILYREASKLARKSPVLSKRVQVFENTRRLVHHATQSFFRVLPHKSDSAEGLLASGVYLDEVHAMRSRKLYAALRWSGAARRQPLVFEITTAGVDEPSLCRDRYRYSKRVADGEHRDTAHLALIFEADKDAELDDVTQLRKANPSLGATIDEPTLVKEAHQVQAEGPSAVSEFKRYRMNIFVGAEQAWLDLERWDKAQARFKLEDFASRPAYAGLDLAKVADFSAFCLLWPPADPEDEAGLWHAAWWFWIPEAQVKLREAAGDMSFTDWAERGLIDVTAGNTTDHKLVRRQINELAEGFNIKLIGVDRNFEGWQFTQDLFEDDELPAVGVGQGWKSQDVPMTRIESLILEGRLNGGGNPVARWQLGNAIAKRVGPNGNYHLDKAKAADKVDAVAALINAFYCALVEPEEQTPDGHYDESVLP